MRRLIVWTIVVCLVCIAALSAAVFIGHHQPIPERIAALHLADCQLPCWMGITLGQTPAKIVRQHFSEAFTTVTYAQGETAFFSLSARPEDNVSILLYGQNSIADEVLIVSQKPDEHMPSLYEIFSVYGVPACIGKGDSARPFEALLYTDTSGADIMEIGVRRLTLDWKLPVNTIHIFKPGDNALGEDGCSPQFTVRWQGLRNFVKIPNF